MKRGLLALSLVALLLQGCGGVKNLDSLGGYGGPADTARYGFESSTQGWAAGTDASATHSVFQAAGKSIFGQGSLGVSVQGMSASLPGETSVLFSSHPSLSGKAITAWVYAPGSAAYSASVPSYALLYLKDASAKLAKGPTVNLIGDSWILLQFSPVANPSASPVNNGIIYTDPGFDPSSIAELGVQIQASGSAPSSFGFTGVFLVDSVNW